MPKRETKRATGAAPNRIDPRLRDLYAVPLAEFTAARDALAGALAAEGNADAPRVKRLRRPTVALWLLNALARERADALSALFAAGDGLRQAQVRALEGDAAQLRTGAAALHDTVATLVGAAQEIAAARLDREAGASTLGEVERALRAVATADAEARAELQAAVLARLPEPGGVELLAGLTAVPGAEVSPSPAETRSGEEPPEDRTAAPRSTRDRAAERARAAAEKHARAEAARRERERERASFEADRLERGHRAAEEQLGEAERRLEEAERRVAAARKDAEAARARAVAARAKADAAERDQQR